ncbi:MAG TPA: hypothetical protein VFB36_05460 [Nevskiaceae bacterium]|nr:hypothetical protein [Nevskiaceae bacterium]
MTQLEVRAGSIIALRLFDVAFAIDLPRVEALWAQRAGPAPSRSKLTATPAKAVAFDVPPVNLVLDPVDLRIEKQERTAQITARVYDFGVIVIALRIPVSGRDWPGFTQFVNAVDESIGPLADIDLWNVLLAKLHALLAPAMVRPTRSNLQEDYLLAVVNQWSEPISAAELQEQIDLAAVLTGERRPLAEETRRDLLRQRFSYYPDDLVALNWDRAFIYEPRGDSDVEDALEVANAQLLEMRYYDELLDDELPRMYDLVEATRRTTYLLASRRFAALARRLYGLVAEVTELTEKVDNALQVTEDVYLARVYQAALETLRVPKLSAAVDRKLAIIRDTYTALYDEASASRAELLEITIIGLFVFEIVLALIR